MTFDTVFDITQQPYPWHYLAYGLVFLIFGGVWCLFCWDDPRVFQRLAARFFPAFAVVAIMLFLGGSIPEWLFVRRAVRDGTAKVVEGPVENFVPMPANRHGFERFTVRGVAFSYSANSMSGHFENKTFSIWDGRYVRVHYFGKEIVKLEVANEIPQ